MIADYDSILLSRKELRTLKLSAHDAVSEQACSGLLKFGLVDCLVQSDRPGGMPKSIGKCIINDNGMRYLLYRKRNLAKYFALKWTDIIAVAISIIALILSIIAIAL